MALRARFSLFCVCSACVLVAGSLVGCADDEQAPASVGGSAGASGARETEGGGSSLTPDAGGAAGAGVAPAATAKGHLIVVTERESPEINLQYLHVLEDWPADGALENENAVELGELVNVHALGDAVFVHQPEDATVRKLVIDADGGIAGDDTISFAEHGVAGFSGDMIYASSTRAFLLDESAGQLVIWNPAAFEIVGAVALPEAALTRAGLAAQISRGIALAGEAFVAASWRDWDTLAYYDNAAMGVFDVAGDEPELRIIEDDRCASTVTPPFVGADGYVYLVSDAALGFDALANPTRSEKALCVLRFEPGAGEFDPEYFVDLKEVLSSPGFYAAHPMKDGKLLVNLWAPDVDLASVADPMDSGWYWAYPPYFEYAIVDLAKGTSLPVTGIPRAAVQWSLTLREGEDTYVQTYRDDTGSDLHRVDADGTVTKVLSNRSATDVQYLARLER